MMDHLLLAQTLASLSPALEDRSFASIPAAGKNFINGEFIQGSGKPFTTVDPSTGEVLCEFRYSTQKDVDRAVAAARDALPQWASLSGVKRAEIMFRLSRRLAEKSRALAVTESLDGGKPIREARDIDIPLAVQHLFHHAGWADKLTYAGLGNDPRPVGVCAQIIPWNFPLLMAAWKLGPALACGNTVVLKPAETTPLTAFMLAEVLAEVGVPPGVVNVVFGAAETGSALGTHAGVDKVAFTGSTAVGKFLAKSVAGTGKRLTLELGGKGANIIFPDADLRAAVEGVVNGIFYNQGHVCCAGSRLLVHESIEDEFLGMLAARISRIRVGPPLDKNTDVGAINSKQQHNKISAMVNEALSQGAQLLNTECDVPNPAYYIPPTVLTGVETSMSIAVEEVFGPVLATMTFRTPQEAIDLANNTPYGLASGVWTQSPERAAWASGAIRTGVVWINTYNKFDPTAAFGGFRESGFGREGGKAGLEAYCV